MTGWVELIIVAPLAFVAGVAVGLRYVVIRDRGRDRAR